MHTQPGWIIAIDGGGTKIAVAAIKIDPPDVTLPQDLSSARTWIHAGTGSAHPATWPLAAENLKRAIEVALAELDGSPVICLHLALAGAGRVEDQKRVVDYLRTTLVDARLTNTIMHCSGDIDPLLNTALRSSSGPTIAIILGTGSLVASRLADGTTVRAGGWGPMLGDECSGGAIGLAGLQLVTRELDSGRPIAEMCDLAQKIIAELMQGHPPGKLNTLIIEAAADRTRRARLSLMVVKSALEEHGVQAAHILCEHIRAITCQIEQVIARSHYADRSVDLYFSGGLAERCPRLVSAIESSCRVRSLKIGQTRITDPLLAVLQEAITLHVK